MKRSRILSRKWVVMGMSKLWCLYNQYGFDLFLDLVYDSMHINPLCFLKNYVVNLKDECDGRGPKLKIALREGTNNKPSYFKGL